MFKTVAIERDDGRDVAGVENEFEISRRWLVATDRRGESQLTMSIGRRVVDGGASEDALTVEHRYAIVFVKRAGGGAGGVGVDVETQGRPGLFMHVAHGLRGWNYVSSANEERQVIERSIEMAEAC